MYNVLLTCIPMINRFNTIKNIFDINKLNVFIPKNFKQTLSQDDILPIIDKYDIWIVGDEIVSYNILEKSKLKIIIKWGVGVDNIDIDACQKLGIKFSNTPNMFGEEVSDVAIGYLLMLSRHLHIINYEVKEKNNWYKPIGISLYNKKVSVIGYGNIGKILCRKLKSFNMQINVYDPFYIDHIDDNIIFCKNIEQCIFDTNFIICVCSLNENTYHIINKKLLELAKKDMYLINVSRGSIVNENEIVELLDSNHIAGVAFDVFEKEPVNYDTKLKKYNCIFGSHNASNTIEAVDKTNQKVIDYIINNI